MSTIEKALQKKLEAKKKQLEAEGASVEESKPEEKTSLERAASVAKRSEKPTLNKELTTGKEAKEQVPVKSEKVPKKKLYGDVLENNAADINIDLPALEAQGFVSVDSTRRLINEEYRAIKRKLLKNAFGPLSKSLNNSNIIMVSSARPGEGKTFTAVNLALSIAAEKDKTVLLVDADVLRPNVTKTLGVEVGDGLMEYLLDEKQDIADVMYTTNVEKLRIVPAGRSHHLSTELLASQKMQETVDEIASRYPDRIVIIDTPPLIGINETAILTNFAGQAVVVCVEGKSRLTDIDKATSLLNPDMAIGFVVNKAIVSVDEDAGYYGYYYAK
ncbi:XrtA-associated tyrosine autokinase [Alteromonas facilis]|uniref:XrtA-associated tyrosine autokinase n=1 Tax=Alteromonas facilis TaxID=2048004 RepID=UPI000C2875EB|nr:XrtA-associated tyrosine autokinase [Alteromonas facilis]